MVLYYSIDLVIFAREQFSHFTSCGSFAKFHIVTKVSYPIQVNKPVTANIKSHILQTWILWTFLKMYAPEEDLHVCTICTIWYELHPLRQDSVVMQDGCC